MIKKPNDILSSEGSRFQNQFFSEHFTSFQNPQHSKSYQKKYALQLLQNLYLKKEIEKLKKRMFLYLLKIEAQQDTIECHEIGPLTRNCQPNQSLMTFKPTTQNFTKLIKVFTEKSKSMNNAQCVKQYKQRINELQVYTKLLNEEKSNVQKKQQRIINQLKGLKFKAINIEQCSVQTQICFEALKRKQIQIKQLQFNIKEHFEQKILNLEYKQNYLDYLEEALKKKQLQVLNKQQQMQQLQKKLKQQDYRFQVQPLVHLIDSNSLYNYFALLKDRIYEAIEKYQSGNEQGLKLLENHPLYDLFAKYDKYNSHPRSKMQILKLMEVNILEIRYKMQVAEEQLRKVYEHTMELKNHLEEKNMKFIQLNSYEGYLNRYKQLIDKKQQELKIEKQTIYRDFKSLTDQILVNLTDNFDQSRIGETSQISSTSTILKNMQPKNGKQKIFDEKIKQSVFATFKNHQKKGDFEDQKNFLSEKINQLKTQFNDNKKLVNNLSQTTIKLNGQKLTQVHKVDQRISSKNQRINCRNSKLEQIIQMSKNKKLIIKYLTKWFQFEILKHIKDPQISKIFYFNTWRIRQYDPEIFNKILELTSQQYEPFEQKLWSDKCIKDQKSKLFPYKSLSFKRKRFLEQFFDFQRKQFFKNKLKSLLRSITRNKSRKERITIIIAFHRFTRNASKVPRMESSQLKFSALKHTKQNYPIKKSIQSSRVNQSYESNKTSKKAIQQKSNRLKEYEERENQMKLVLEEQRVELQTRTRKLLSCLKIMVLKQKEQNCLYRKKLSCFYKWNKSIASQEHFKRIENKFEQFQFKMELFNTKYKLLQSNFSSKLELMEELLSLVIPK